MVRKCSGLLLESTMILPSALCTAGSVLPSDTRCSRKGFRSFSLLRFSTCAMAQKQLLRHISEVGRADGMQVQPGVMCLLHWQRVAAAGCHPRCEVVKTEVYAAYCYSMQAIGRAPLGDLGKTVDTPLGANSHHDEERTSSQSCSTGMSERTDRMRLFTKSSGASASNSPPTTWGALPGLTFWT